MVGSAFKPGCTLMMDSEVGDAWIQQICRDNPTVMLPGEGRLISSGPCRLAFVDPLFEPRAPTGNPGGQPKYSVAALYSPYTDMNIYYAEYYRVCGEVFPEKWNPHIQGFAELENPFHDCAAKAHKFQGYTPGLTTMNHTSRFKPSIVDSSPARNPITDRSKVYPGCWALLVVNAYAYGKNPPQPKKGVSFGLQAVMIIGDDTNLAGGGIDPREAFKNANVKPPAINPASLAGLVVGRPGAPPMGAPPVTGWAPPGAGGFVPPGPPNPLHAAMAHTAPAADDPFDVSSIS